MATLVTSATVVDSTRKLPVRSPAGISSVAGTLATSRLLVAIPTSAPPSGAGPVSVTVATDWLCPLISWGSSSIRETATGSADGGAGAGDGAGTGGADGAGVGAGVGAAGAPLP